MYLSLPIFLQPLAYYRQWI